MIDALVVTLGVMDGFHLGHRRVMERAALSARNSGARLVAFTFEPPPWVLFRDKPNEPLLTRVDERLALMREAGANEARVLRFDTALAAKSPEDFLIDHIFPFGRLAGLVLGYDFALGHERRGTPEILGEMGRRQGFFVISVPALMEDGVPISSSGIRKALLEGRVEDAARWLGRAYTVSSVVQQGDGRGRQLGFPTANLKIPPTRVSPATGVYAVRVHGLGGDALPGVANLGRRPTFGGEDERLEVHLLQPVGDLEHAVLTVSFAGRIRPEIKFNNAKELTDQIAQDATRARAILGLPQASA